MAAGANTPPSQLEFFTIPSPCIGVCQSGPKGYCIGCFRSRDERLHWQNINDAARRHIIKACHRRKAAANKQKEAKTSQAYTPEQKDLFNDT